MNNKAQQKLRANREATILVERLFFDIIPDDQQGNEICKSHAAIALHDERLDLEYVTPEDVDVLGHELRAFLMKLGSQLKTKAEQYNRSGFPPERGARFLPFKTVDNIHWIKVEFANAIRGTGEAGAALADGFTKLLREAKDDPGQGVVYFHLHGLVPGESHIPLLKAAAYTLWIDRVQYEAGQNRGVVELQSYDDHKGHALLPKHTAPMAWAFGGTGRLSPQGGVQIDGHQFLEAPGMPVYVSKTACLMPKAERYRPHQTTLALGVDEPFEALPVAIANATRSNLLSTVAAKILLQTVASKDVCYGKLVEAELGDITARVHPGVTRIQKAQITATAKGFDSLRHFYLFLPDGTKVQILDIRDAIDPNEAQRHLRYRWGLGRNFQEVVREAKECRGKIKAYNGDIMMNMTGAMELPSNKAVLLRLYIQAAAVWNASYLHGGHYDRNKQPWQTWNDIAIRANALSPEVVEYLRATTADRVTLRRLVKSDAAKQRKQIEDACEELESRKLAVIQKEPGQKRYRLEPHGSFLEAQREMLRGRPAPSA